MKFFVYVAAAVVLLLSSMFLVRTFPDYILVIMPVGMVLGSVLGNLLSAALWDYLDGEDLCGIDGT